MENDVTFNNNILLKTTTSYLNKVNNATVPVIIENTTVENQQNETTHNSTDLIEIIIYSICLCIGGPLNLLSFWRLSSRFFGSKNNVMMSNSKNNTTHLTLLKLNLNIADLLTMFVYTLSQIIWMITYQWYFGDLLCRICKFFHTFSFYLNSFVVACFAIDKALGTYNLSRLNAANDAYLRVRRMLMIAWIFAFLLSLPQSFIFRVVEPRGMANFKQCTPIWTILGHEIELEMNSLTANGLLTEAHRSQLIYHFQEVVKWERVYNIAHLMFVFWIPVIIIIASYVTVLCVLNSFSVPKGWKGGMSFSIKRFSKFQQSSDATRNLKLELLNSDSTLKFNGNNNDNNNGSGESEFQLLRANSCKAKTAPSRDCQTVQCAALNVMVDTANGIMKRDIGSIALKRIEKARRKTKRQAALILLAYLTFWTPYNLLAVMNTFSPQEGMLKQISSVTLPFLNSMIVINPIVNPLIYGIYQERQK